MILGLIAVASNPAPYFAAFGLVLVSGVGCWVLIESGGSFLSLALFLIYLGGILVVFAYSAALAAEPFPETWGSGSVVGYVVVYLLGVSLMGWFFSVEWFESLWFVAEEFKGFFVLRCDFGGVAMVYWYGGDILVICVWVLLLTLFVVLELTRGVSRGVLRAI